MGLTPDSPLSIKKNTSVGMDPKGIPFMILFAFEKMVWVDDGTAGEAHIWA
jgi:hypothetical protein